jgi:hypothetical protein
VDHPSCQQYMDDVDRIQGQMKNFRKKIDKLKIRDAVME